MKKIIAFVFALSICITLCACGGEPQASAKPSEAAGAPSQAAQVTYTIAAATQTTGQNWDLERTALIEALTEASGGRFVADSVDAGMQGDSREMVTSIQSGVYQIGVLGDMEIDTVIGSLGWAWSPFLITSYEQADEVYYNGWINEMLKEKMAESGIIKIGNAECGFRVCATVNNAINSMGDFNGVKIRTPGLTDVISFYEMCGATAVSIAPSEVAMALQQKTCDGLDNAIVNIKNMGALEMCKNICRTNHVYAGGSIVANAEWWNSLSAEDQQMVLDACKKVDAKYMQAYRDEETELYKSFSGEISTPSDEFMAQFIEIGQKIWEGNKSKWDGEIVSAVEKQLAANVEALK